MIIYDNLSHVEHDLRQTCWNGGNQRCGHIDGRCNKLERFPYDDRWLTLKAEMEEELKYE
jgi:hypothetical protein